MGKVNRGPSAMQPQQVQTDAVTRKYAVPKINLHAYTPFGTWSVLSGVDALLLYIMSIQISPTIVECAIARKKRLSVSM